jgi:hypothetical protein
LWGWGSIEADFQKFYKIDLVQEGFSNTISWRRFLILVRGLPKDSAWRTWYSNDEDRKYAEWKKDAVDINA